MATDTAIDVVMPQMGVSVSEGTITKWLKNEGEEIAADESLLEISTDKVDTEVPSPGSGVVLQILVQEGQTVDVGTKLAVIGPEGAAPAPAAETPPEPATAEAAAESSAASSAEGTATAEPQAPEPAPAAPATPAPTDGAADGKSFVSPVVARIASEHGIDVGQVSGTGRGGRVTKKDILGFIEGGGPAEAPAQPAQPAEPAQPAQPPPPAPAEPAAQPPAQAAPAPAAAAPAQPEAGAGESLEPMSAMRKGIAEH